MGPGTSHFRGRCKIPPVVGQPISRKHSLHCKKVARMFESKGNPCPRGLNLVPPFQMGRQAMGSHIPFGSRNKQQWCSEKPSYTTAKINHYLQDTGDNHPTSIYSTGQWPHICSSVVRSTIFLRQSLAQKTLWKDCPSPRSICCNCKPVCLSESAGLPPKTKQKLAALFPRSLPSFAGCYSLPCSQQGASCELRSTCLPHIHSGVANVSATKQPFLPHFPGKAGVEEPVRNPANLPAKCPTKTRWEVLSLDKIVWGSFRAAVNTEIKRS